MAEEPVFAGAEKPPEEVVKPEAKLTAELGSTLSLGNVDFFTAAGSLTGSYRARANKVSLVLGGLYGMSHLDVNADGVLADAEKNADWEKSAQKLGGEVRYDRFFLVKNSGYVLFGALNDPFAGYDLRTHEQVGYSRLLVKSPKTEVATEIGVDYAQEYYVPDSPTPDQQILAGRLMARVNHTFKGSLAFNEQIEYFQNLLDPEFDDFRLLNTASIDARLSNKLGLKLSHALTYDTTPVEVTITNADGTTATKALRRLDQIATLTLVVTVL